MSFTEKQLSNLLMKFSCVMTEFNVLEDDLVEIVVVGKNSPLIVYVSRCEDKSVIKVELFSEEFTSQDDESLIKTFVVPEQDLDKVSEELKEYISFVS